MQPSVRRPLPPLLAAAVAALAISAAGASAAPRVTATPSVLTPNSPVTLDAFGMRPGTRVTFMIGPPNSEASPIAAATATSAGRARVRVGVDPSAGTGRWIILACQRECRVKAATPLTIVERIVTPAEARTRVTTATALRADACRLTTTRIRVTAAPATWIVSLTGTTRRGPVAARWSVHKASGALRVVNADARTVMGGCR